MRVVENLRGEAPLPSGCELIEPGGDKVWMNQLVQEVPLAFIDEVVESEEGSTALLEESKWADAFELIDGCFAGGFPLWMQTPETPPKGYQFFMQAPDGAPLMPGACGDLLYYLFVDKQKEIFVACQQ